MIANSSFPKKEEQPVTFYSIVAKNQIDYLLLRKGDIILCKDCRVIPSENLTTQHKLFVIDLEIKKERKNRSFCDEPKIKWGGLTIDRAQELGQKSLAIGAWRSSKDASSMWDRTASYIREAAREVLRVSRGYVRGR